MDEQFGVPPPPTCSKSTSAYVLVGLGAIAGTDVQRVSFFSWCYTSHINSPKPLSFDTCLCFGPSLEPVQNSAELPSQQQLGLSSVNGISKEEFSHGGRRATRAQGGASNLGHGWGRGKNELPIYRWEGTGCCLDGAAVYNMASATAVLPSNKHK